MSLQTYFKEFNKVIKMDYDVKSELKEKRDILLGICIWGLNHWIKNMI